MKNLKPVKLELVLPGLDATDDFQLTVTIRLINSEREVDIPVRVQFVDGKLDVEQERQSLA